jgi:hypothetical protein
MKKYIGIIVAGLFLAMVHVPSANAELLLYFYSGNDTLVISDGASTDDNGSKNTPNGAINYSQAVFGTWNVSITTNFDPSGSFLHLGGIVSTTSNTSATLGIFAVQTGLPMSDSGFQMQSSGFTYGTVSQINAYYESSGQSSGYHGSPDISFGPFIGSYPFLPAFLTKSASGSAIQFSSVALEAVITESTGKITNFDVQLSSVPEPTLLILLGLGLSGLGLTMKKWM